MAKEGFRRLVENNTTECMYMYILKILSEEPLHAYVIRKEMEERFGFRPGPVTAYKVLYDLKRDGLVVKRLEGRLKIYKITNKGKKELERVINFYKERINLLQ